MIKPLPFNIRFLSRIVCLVAVLTSYFNASNAQQAYLTAGGNINGAGGSVSYSVGQTAYMFNTGANGNVQQGVQQPAFAPYDATLSNLAVVGATISPAFGAATTVYTSSVSASVASITVTPTATEASTTITYNNTLVTSGLPITVPLVNGYNIIPFIVTAAGGATKTYTLTITKTVPPTLNYGSGLTFALDEPISPVTPSSTNVGALGYNAPAAIGKSIGGGFIKAVVDSTGNTYIISSSKTTIQVIPASGAAAYEIGGPFNSPVGMALDKAGNLYVAERTALYKVVPATGITTLVPDITLTSATSIAAGDDGNLYIVNRRRIYKYEIGTGNFNEIDTSIAGVVNIAAKGNTLYYSVLISSQQAIFRMSLDGSNRSIVAQPDGFAVDGDLTGHVYGGGLNDISRYGGDDGLILNVGAAYNLSTDLKGNIYYAAAQDSLVKKLTPSGGYFIDKELPSGLALNAATGIISGTPQALSPAATYTVTAYGGTQSVVSSFTLATVVNNRDLSALTVSGTTIGDSFNADTTGYNAVTAANLDSLTITPTAAAAGSTITCNGITVASGSGIKVPVVTGANTFVVVVTSEFGTAKTYTVNIKRGVPVSLDYGPEQTFTVNKAITAITPAATNVLPWGYNNPRKKFRPELFGSHFLIGLTDSAGTNYVATINPENGFKSFITVVPANGAPAYQIGGDFQYINAAIIDKDGNLYVTEDGGGIYKIVPSTNTRTRIPFTIDNPQIRALALDDNGRLYIGDARNGLYILDQTTGITTKVEGTKAIFSIAIYDNYIFYNDFAVLYRSELNGNNKVTITAPGSEQLVSFFDPAGYYYTGKTFVQRVGKKEYALDPNGDQVIKGFIRVPPTFGIGGTGIDTSTPQGSLIDYSASIDGKGRFLSGLTNATVLLDVPSGGYYIDKRLPPGMDFDAETGIISGTPTKSWPKTNYHITAYNEQENAVSTFTLAVKNDLALTNLITDAGSLTPTFNADSTSYHLTVNNGTTSASITATLSDTTNRLSIGGATATSGTLASIALNTGDNAIPVVVTATDNTSKTYTVNVHRISNDYKLHNLTVSNGTLTPTFDANTNNYVVQLPNGTTSATLTPTADTLATIKVADVPVVNGTQSQSLSLNSGDNHVEVLVTAEDGTSATIYNINFQVASASAITLSNVAVNTGILSPAFSSAIANYSVTVPTGTANITVTPTLADNKSTITVNGAALDQSGNATLALNNGLNTISVAVLSDDNTTTNAYTITVNKLIPAPVSSAIAAQVYKTGAQISPLSSGFSNVGTPGYFPVPEIYGQIITPTGTAINKAGEVYVASYSGDVYKIPAIGGNPTIVASGFNAIFGIAVDRDDNLYIAALGDSGITKITTTNVRSVLGDYQLPTSVAFDTDNNMYVTSISDHALYKTTAQNVTTLVTDELTTPYSVTTDAEDNVYVADPTAQAVIKISKNGTKENLITNLTGPIDVKINAAGDIFVADGATQEIVKYDQNGQNPLVISKGYNGLFGLSLNKDGKIYISDNGAESVNKVIPTGAYFLSEPLPAGLTFNNITGIISGTPTKTSAPKDYVITAYNTGGGTSQTINISVVANATLANLTANQGTLTPAFNSNTETYTVNVANNITEIKLTPTVNDANATVKVKGVDVISGSESGALPLVVGSNLIPVLVTGSDGTATKNYNVTVNRENLSDATLASIILNNGTLSTAFDPEVLTYTATVSPNASTTQVKALSADSLSEVKVNGVIVTHGNYSDNITLPYGSSTIAISVTARDNTLKQYTLTVNRTAPVNNISLSDLSITPGTLARGSGTDTFTAKVSNSTGSIKLKAAISNPTATLKLNGQALAQSTYSDAVSLNVGVNTINLEVTAQDGVTKRNITVLVTRAASSNVTLSDIALSSGTLARVGNSDTFSATVSSAVTNVMLKASVGHPNATLKLNGQQFAQGIFSLPVNLATGVNTLNLEVTAEDGVTKRNITVLVTRPVSTSTALAQLDVTPGTLVRGSAVDNYTVAVGNATSSITLRAATAHPYATIKLNGQPLAQGVYSNPVPLTVGVNNLILNITAEDGTTTRSIKIAVTRAVSTSVSLAELTLSSGTLIAGTASDSYTASVTNVTSSLRLKASITHPSATLKLNGQPLAQGVYSDVLPLSIGDNILTLEITAEDGTTRRNITIVVTRSGNANIIAVSKEDANKFITKNANSYTASAADIVVHQGVSPNGDGFNDFLVIEGLSSFRDNKLSIMNSSGALVYEMKDYGADANKMFDGHSNKTGKTLTPGTYYYVLDYKEAGKDKRKTGFLILKY